MRPRLGKSVPLAILLLQHFLLWAGLRDDLVLGKAAYNNIVWEALVC